MLRIRPHLPLSCRTPSLETGKFVWTREPPRGYIQNLTFKNIRAGADPLRIALTGFAEAHTVSDAVLQDVRVNRKSPNQADVKANAFVRNVRVSP